LILFAWTIAALAGHAWALTVAAPVPFVAPAAAAGAIALLVRDVERGRVRLRHVGPPTLVLVFLLARDLHRMPEKTLLALGVPSFELSTRIAHTVERAWLAVSIVAAIAWAAACVVERFGAVARARPARLGGLLIAGGAAAGAIARVWVYPALAADLAPKGALATYERFGGGEPLGVLGVNARAVAYEGIDAAPMELGDVRRAYDWLNASGADRRWLLARAAELPGLHAAYRATAPLRRVPVVDGRGSVVLVVNRPPDGASVDDPLERTLPSEPPTPQHAVDARFGDRVELLGWSLFDDDERPLDAFPAHGRAHLRVYYRVLSAMAGYCSFVHVDHSPARHTAEHKAWPYPMALWQRGDVIADDFEMELPTYFGRGDYPLLFGFGQLPCTDERRLEVTRGSHDAHRVRAGSIHVR
jgi:hypothetical protein